MRIIPTRSLLIFLSAIFFIGSLLTGCATTSSKELDPAMVRQDLDLWEEGAWVDLTTAEQELWGVLGWTEASWEGEAKKPPSEDKYWRQLSDEERNAAEKLGYTKDSWDE